MTTSPSRSAAPASSEARTAVKHHRVLLTLSGSVTISYGVLYYAFPVLVSDMSAETGWATSWLTAAFSAGLLVAAVIGVPVGRWLDRHGPRGLMTAGSALGAIALVPVALAPNFAVFAAGWLLAGIAMAAVLYPPAFTAVTRWYVNHSVRALTVLTLVAGLSSTIFAPLVASLLGRLGWSQTYLVLAAVLALVTVPAHWWGLRGRWPDAGTAAATDPSTSTPAQIAQDDTARTGTDPTDASGADAGPRGRGRILTEPHTATAVTRSLPFAALFVTLALASLTAMAVVVNLVPFLVQRGFDTGTASWVLALGGIGQVVGRLCYPLLSRHTGVRVRTVAIVVAIAASTALFGVAASIAMMVTVSIIAGVGRGLMPLLQATAVSDRWGTAHYGRLTGLLSAPVTVTMAISPWAGAALADMLGGYAPAFLLLAAVSAVAAAVAVFSVPRRLDGIRQPGE